MVERIIETIENNPSNKSYVNVFNFTELAGNTKSLVGLLFSLIIVVGIEEKILFIYNKILNINGIKFLFIQYFRVSTVCVTSKKWNF